MVEAKMKKNIFALCAIIMLCIIMSVCLIACDDNSGDNDGPSIADNTEHYDDITKSLTLEKSYEGKSFLKDGIGVATVSAFTDGDTTRFRAGDDTVVIRYYCIDTPESTGSVEKWGKAASLFVKEQLSNATLIVLESSTGGKPTTDSYGSRYLGYVWYKGANDANLKNLNLELIENGYTDNKAINTSDYPYYSQMYKANQFARSIKLRLYSDLDDPLYSTDPVEMTIKDFWDNLDAYYNTETESGSKVIFEAYFEDLTVSNSGTYTYTAVQYDPETGERYELNVYAAYSSSAATKMKLGYKFRVIGTINLYYGNYQVSGITYNEIYQDKQPDGSYITQKDYYLTFNSDVSYRSQHSATLYSSVTVTSVETKDGTLTFVGKAYKCTAANKYSDEAKEFTFSAKIPDGYTSNVKVGDRISINGYQLELNSGKITIANVQNVLVKSN